MLEKMAEKSWLSTIKPDRKIRQLAGFLDQNGVQKLSDKVTSEEERRILRLDSRLAQAALGDSTSLTDILGRVEGLSGELAGFIPFSVISAAVEKATPAEAEMVVGYCANPANSQQLKNNLAFCLGLCGQIERLSDTKAAFEPDSWRLILERLGDRKNEKQVSDENVLKFLELATPDHPPSSLFNRVLQAKVESDPEAARAFVQDHMLPAVKTFDDFSNKNLEFVRQNMAEVKDHSDKSAGDILLARVKKP